MCSWAVGGERHAGSKLSRTVVMKIVVRDSKKCSIAADCETVDSYRLGVDEIIAFDFSC